MIHTNRFESLQKVKLRLVYSTSEGSKLYNNTIILPFIEKLFFEKCIKKSCDLRKKTTYEVNVIISSL